MTSEEKNKRRVQNEKIIIAFFLGAIIAICITLFGLGFIAERVETLILSFIIIIAILGLIFLLITINKERILNKALGIESTKIVETKQNIKNLFGGIKRQNWENTESEATELVNKAINWYTSIQYRKWVIAVFYTLFLGFAGLLGSVLIFNQNELITQQNQIILRQDSLLTEQNGLIQNQNHRLDQQTYLQEAERRSSLVFLFANIMDAIDRELKDDVNKNNIRDLSPQLIGRIIALSSRLKPYYYLEEGRLIGRAISPERGQLLVALIESQLDTSTYDKIYEKANFKMADLVDADLRGSYLRGVTLEEADLTWADMTNAKLQNADLNNATLMAARLDSAKLIETNLVGADLQGAHFINSKMKKTDLSMSDISDTDFTDAKFDTTYVDFGWFDTLKIKSDSTYGTNFILENYKIERVPKKGYALIKN